MLTDFNWIQAMGSSPILLVLLGCSVLTLGVVLERTYFFWKRRAPQEQAVAHALEKVRSGDANAASFLCGTTLHPMGPVGLAVFRSVALPSDALEEKLQIALSEQKLLLERNVGLLGTMAAIAPLVGLLGTVWGIMRAFHDMARSGSAAPSVVAAGVAEALVTTAAGLIVAVPAVMLYNHFTRRTNVMLTLAENHARNLRMSLQLASGASATSAPTTSAGSPVVSESSPAPVNERGIPQMAVRTTSRVR